MVIIYKNDSNFKHFTIIHSYNSACFNESLFWAKCAEMGKMAQSESRKLCRDDWGVICHSHRHLITCEQDEFPSLTKVSWTPKMCPHTTDTSGTTNSKKVTENSSSRLKQSRVYVHPAAAGGGGGGGGGGLSEHMSPSCLCFHSISSDQTSHCFTHETRSISAVMTLPAVPLTRLLCLCWHIIRGCHLSLSPCWCEEWDLQNVFLFI